MSKTEIARVEEISEKNIRKSISRALHNTEVFLKKNFKWGSIIPQKCHGYWKKNFFRQCTLTTEYTVEIDGVEVELSQYHKIVTPEDIILPAQ